MTARKKRAKREPSLWVVEWFEAECALAAVSERTDFHSDVTTEEALVEATYRASENLHAAMVAAITTEKGE